MYLLYRFLHKLLLFCRDVPSIKQQLFFGECIERVSALNKMRLETVLLVESFKILSTTQVTFDIQRLGRIYRYTRFSQKILRWATFNLSI